MHLCLIIINAQPSGSQLGPFYLPRQVTLAMSRDMFGGWAVLLASSVGTSQGYCSTSHNAEKAQVHISTTTITTIQPQISIALRLRNPTHTSKAVGQGNSEKDMGLIFFSYLINLQRDKVRFVWALCFP